ncbi:MAG TPA: hypothetical protein VIA06_06790 [Candidatus Dormibacteraeota bacterium]|jgi:hypothetical protein|nr:hypothetical protein [Candidatus Dormibacteraeota bacterium]
MNAPELALHHQRLSLRAAQVRNRLGHVEEQLATDPVVNALEEQLAAARDRRRHLELRLRESDGEASAQRARVRSRRGQLMSGRIRNPTELVKLTAEVDRLAEELARDEDQELVLMQDAEELDAELASLERQLEEAQARREEARGPLEGQRSDLAGQLQQLESERDETWTSLPAEWRRAYEQASNRLRDPVGEVVSNQCQGCRVQVTSNGMQILRRGGLIRCDNCDRVLVIA